MAGSVFTTGVRAIGVWNIPTISAIVGRGFGAANSGSAVFWFERSGFVENRGSAVFCSAVFCFFRGAAVVPFGLTVRGLRAFFSFGFSSGFDLAVLSGSFFLRGFRTLVASGVAVFLALFAASGLDCGEAATPTPESSWGCWTRMTSS